MKPAGQSEMQQGSDPFKEILGSNGLRTNVEGENLHLMVKGKKLFVVCLFVCFEGVVLQV